MVYSRTSAEVKGIARAISSGHEAVVDITPDPNCIPSLMLVPVRPPGDGGGGDRCGCVVYGMDTEDYEVSGVRR
jgi:hypothetical protein